MFWTIANQRGSCPGSSNTLRLSWNGWTSKFSCCICRIRNTASFQNPLRRHPLLSGFYKLLANAVRVTTKAGRFQIAAVDDSTVVALTAVGSRALSALKQHRDNDLRVACLQLILSLPAAAVQHNLSSLEPALRVAVDLGLSHLPMIGVLLEALDTWVEEMDEDTGENAWSVSPRIDLFCALPDLCGSPRPTLFASPCSTLSLLIFFKRTNSWRRCCRFSSPCFSLWSVPRRRTQPGAQGWWDGARGRRSCNAWSGNGSRMPPQDRWPSRSSANGKRSCCTSWVGSAAATTTTSFSTSLRRSKVAV